MSILTFFIFILIYYVICILGGTPDKRISKGQLSRVYYFFLLVFIGIIGGTPDKRISEGLFCPFCFCLVVCFYRHYRGNP